MKKHISLAVLVAISILVTTKLSAQQDTVINGVHYKLDKNKNPEYTKAHKRLIPLDSEWVNNNQRFRYYNKWFTVGAGVQQNLSYAQKLGFTIGADLNFHIKRNYFQTGIELAGPNYGNYSNYEFHAGYGLRYEDKDVQFSAFLGPSYSTGYKTDSVNSPMYRNFGVYVQAEIIKKIAYDVGLGFAFYVDWNEYQTIAGMRAILYFSGSYRGKKVIRNDN